MLNIKNKEKPFKYLFNINLFFLILVTLCISCDNEDDNRSPVLDIVSPEENEVFIVGEIVSFQVKSNDPDGIIENVTIKVNDEQISILDFEPYTYEWSTDSYQEGIYNITITATDNEGLSTTLNTQISLEVEDPSIVTLPFSQIGTTHLRSGLIIQSNGNPSIQQKGICWNTTTNPTVDDNIIYYDEIHNFGQEIPILISGLSPNTEYFVRAWSYNGISVTYGEETSASTLNSYVSNTGSITDSRDGTNYSWVQIGNQKWFAENLTYTVGMVDDGYQYISTPFGPLYGLYPECPNGWHIPTYDEWMELIDFVGGEEVAGGVLKEVGTDNWIEPNLGASDTAGFRALPTGYGIKGIFGPASHSGLYSFTYFLIGDSIKRVGLGTYGESAGFPFYGNGALFGACRCIED